MRLISIPQVLDLPDDRLPCEITLIATDLLVTMLEHEVAPFMTAPKVSGGGRCVWCVCLCVGCVGIWGCLLCVGGGCCVTSKKCLTD